MMRLAHVSSCAALAGTLCLAAPAAPQSADMAGPRAWTPAQPLSGPVLLINLQLEVSVAANLSGNTVAAWNANSIIMAATHTSGGAWSPAADVSRAVAYEDVYEPRVAIGSSLREAVAIWTSCTAVPDQQRVYAIKVAYWRPIGGWEPPVTLASSTAAGLGSPRIAVSRLGRAQALWQKCQAGTCVIQAASGSRTAPWTAPADISPAGVTVSAPQLAVNRRGDAVALWLAAAATGTQVQAAFRSARGGWEPAVDVSIAEPGTYGPKAALDALGGVVAVWNQNTVIMASTRARAGGWTTPVALSTTPSYRPPDVAVDLDGNAVAAWSDGFAQVATLPSGGTWSAPLQVSTIDEDAADPRVGVSADGVLKVVTWADNIQNTARAVTQMGTAAWAAPVSLGGGVWEGSVELAVALGAQAVWGVPHVFPQQVWVPTASAFLRGQ